ncbi:MAG: hypothetical protein KDI48_14820, partial [Xanthomonadales bacterium]|nr:hypothetical protein [Xanthomonadales bacterium]
RSHIAETALTNLNKPPDQEALVSRSPGLAKVRVSWAVALGRRAGPSRLGDVDKLLQPVAGVPGELTLGISVRHYLGLVDWTGRVMHPTKRGKIDGAPPSVLDSLGLRDNAEQRPALLDRFELSDRAWTHQVKGTESDFYRVIGAAERILTYAEDIGQQWLQGIGVARLLNERRAKPKPA